MKLVARSFVAIFIRPSILIFLGIVIGVISFLVNVVGGPIVALTQVGINDGVASSLLSNLVLYVTALLNVLGFFQDPKILAYTVGGIIFGVIILAAIFAIGFSGYFNTVYHALDRQPKKKHFFVKGVQTFFFRIWKMNIIFLFITVIMFIITSIAIVPTVTFLSTSTEWMHGWGIALAIVTTLVIFFTTIYYIIYMAFWYPAVFTVSSQPFKYAKKIIDNNFLGVFLRILFLGAFFIIGNSLFEYVVTLIAGDLAAIGLILKWIFNTLFLAFASTYVFALYRYLDRRASRTEDS